MSTSDFGGAGGLGAADGAGNRGIDVGELSRLANDLFKQLNGAESAPSFAAAAPSGVPVQATPSPVSSGAGASAGSFPRAEPYAVPPSTWGGAPAPTASPLADRPSGGRPAAQLQPQTGGAQYYFLEHARPGSSAGPGAALPEAAPLSIPTFGTDLQMPRPSSLSAPFDVNRVRRDFPILSERVNGQPLIWLDNAATTQKPQSVIDRLTHFYEHENSNIHRAAHELAARATDAYEAAREKVRGFLNARSSNEIVFARGATEAINLVAQAWGRANIQPGDEIIVSHLEHHANIVPWQLLAEEKGAKLLVIPVDDDGQVLLSGYGKLLGKRTKLVSFTQVSNALGTVTPAREIVAMAHAAGALVLVDGAQAVSHMPVDVQSLDADFYVFSGHKVFGPTGIGVLYGKEGLLNEMPPWQGGGNMIADVTFERSIYQKAPGRFEAGTGNIADAVGLGAAIDYVTRIGMPAIEAYEHSLLVYGTARLQQIRGLRIIGTAAEKAGVLSFTLDGFRTDEVSHALNDHGIAVRGGHHCAQPILRRMGVESTVRPSLAFYNNCADLDALVEAVLRIQARKSADISGRPFTFR